MKTRDILNLSYKEINKMNVKELKSILSVLASTANKRIKTFERKGLTSPAIRYVRNERFSVANKNINQLRHEFVRARNFLNAETSTIRGHNKVKEKVISSLSKHGVTFSSEQYEKFFEIYEDLRELSPSIGYGKFKYAVMKELGQYMENIEDKDAVILKAQERLNDIYEKYQQGEIENGRRKGVSEFFELK